MIRINENYLKLSASYLFAEITKRTNEFVKANPDTEIIKLGLGDVTRGLPPACIEAFHKAVDEQAHDATFHGYGPYTGYEFLRAAIAQHDFQAFGADISADEVFVSDGAKPDTGNIQELFATDVKVAVSDPVYPVYVDTNVMAGRSGGFKDGKYEGILYLDSTEENHYIPDIPNEKVDLIYLCFPNNPTGATVTKEKLAQWVDYARDSKALILFDAAYVAFIRDDSVPKSIFEIDGAKEVAIEFRSFSKTAGFTGTRCAYTVVPKSCTAYDSKGNKHFLHGLWSRRVTTKSNGVSYPVQRAAEAAFSEEGAKQVRGHTDYYLKNATLIKDKMSGLGYKVTGGENSPYLWIKTNTDSWEFFDLLLNKAAVVTTPGSGFGSCGEGYIRISSFNNYENVEVAMQRITDVLKK
ncbi:LL-diaminopimelate aminotransferase [Fibrobacterota bacterium]